MADQGQDAVGDKQIADIIQHAKAQLEQMIDLNPECMVLVDREGQVLRANRAFLKLLDEGQFQSVLGLPLAELFPRLEADFFDNLLANRTDHSWFQKNEKAGDGTDRLLQFGVVSAGMSSEALVVIVHDVSRDKEKSALLEKAYKVEANQALMGALMHHLNQPLTVVMIRSRMMLLALEEGNMEHDELVTALKDIEEHALQMSDLLKRIEDTKDYETQEYVRGLDILKVEKPKGDA